MAEHTTQIQHTMSTSTAYSRFSAVHQQPAEAAPRAVSHVVTSHITSGITGDGQHGAGLPRSSRQLGQAFAAALGGELVLSQCASRTYQDASCVLRYGQTCQFMAFIEKGQLNAVLQPASSGAQIVPVTFTQGEYAGLSQLWCEEPIGFDLVAVGTCTIRWVARKEIERLVVRSPALLQLLLRFLSQRLRDVQLRERAWLERGVHERVRATLIRMVRERDGALQGPPRLVTTHEALAMRCGISRPKLSQELKALQACGAVRLGRGLVEILDMAQLAQ